MNSPGMFSEGFCQRHTISLFARLLLCTASPKAISNSSAARKSSLMPAKAQRPPSGLPSVFPGAVASVHRTKCSGPASRPVASRKAAATTTKKLSVPLWPLLGHQGRHDPECTTGRHRGLVTQRTANSSDPSLGNLSKGLLGDSLVAGILQHHAVLQFLEANEASANTMDSTQSCRLCACSQDLPRKCTLGIFFVFTTHHSSFCSLFYKRPIH